MKKVCGVEIAPWREEKIGLINFYANEEEQREFAKNVHYDNYEAEFYEWWQWDSYIENGEWDEVWKAAFSKNELEKIAEFYKVYDDAQGALNSENDWPIEKLLESEAWKSTVKAAINLAKVFE